MLLVFMSLLLFLIGGLGIYGMISITKGIREVYQGSVEPLRDISRIDNLYGYHLQNIILNFGNKNYSESQFLNELTAIQKEIKSAWKEYLRDTSNEDLASRKETISLLNSANNYIESLKHIKSDESFNELSNKFNQNIDPVLQSLETLSSHYAQQTLNDYERETTLANKLIILMIVFIILGLFIGNLLAYIIIRNIFRGFNRAVEIANRLASGDASIEITDCSVDEIGQLMQAMKKMLTMLQKVIKEIQQEIGVLSSSSSEIASSVTQVAAGTSETAAAVTETTTTVEELKQTAHLSSDKAQNVLNSSEEAMQVVKNSEMVLKATIDDMNQIEERMKIISDSIGKLNERTLVIGKIIETVNDLAEQSNLLAVNAAIEASKAGEQGKGFNVVAQEIRVLASQSKAATVQVRSILDDIQNATNSVVMATEQGSKAVMMGVERSNQTGEAILSLEESISKVSQNAKQIAISSQQQMVGVDQVTTAMTNINEATSQHVLHIQQIETAIKGFQNVGNALKEVADQYKL